MHLDHAPMDREVHDGNPGLQFRQELQGCIGNGFYLQECNFSYLFFTHTHVKGTRKEEAKWAAISPTVSLLRVSEGDQIPRSTITSTWTCAHRKWDFKAPAMRASWETATMPEGGRLEWSGKKHGEWQARTGLPQPRCAWVQTSAPQLKLTVLRWESELELPSLLRCHSVEKSCLFLFCPVWKKKFQLRTATSSKLKSMLSQ